MRCRIFKNWMRNSVLALAIFLGSSVVTERGPVYAAETEKQSEAAAEDSSPDESKVQEEGSEGADISAPVNRNITGYDVVFCIDNSGSVWEQQEERDEALRSISNLAVGSDIRIGGVYFGGSIYKSQNLTSMETKEGSTQVMQEFLHMTDRDEQNRATNIGKALEAAQTLFENQDASRKRIIILFSDGINEDVGGTPEYIRRANHKTEEQMKILESHGIPVYCVYLQKERNDEEYLIDLVNYFNDDNSYEDERFKKVTNNQIGKLSQQFAEIFYAMQNDMRYRELSVDSSGKTSFYVPSLGVEKLQLYLNNNGSYQAVLAYGGEEDSSKDSWQDGNSAYISVENPAKGDWYLEVSGDDPAGTSGTIAYYADLYASLKLTREGGIEVPVYKNQSAQVKIIFYDGDGKEIVADDAAQITGDFILTKESGEKVEIPLEFSNSDNGCLSNVFVVDSYGSYAIESRIVYEDFVDLSYEAKDGIIEKQPPVTHNKTGTFVSTKKGDKETFTFRESELYSDPEKEMITITGVNLLDESNPVTVDVKDGIVTVTADKTGAVKFALNVEDSTGLEGIVTVDGQIQSKTFLRFLKIAKQVIAVLVILLLLKIVIKRWKTRREITRLNLRVKDMQREGEDVIKSLDTAEIDNGMMTVETYEQGLEKMRTTCLENLIEEQIKEYGVEKYLTRTEGDNAFKKLKDSLARVCAAEGALKTCLNKAETIEKETTGINLKDSLKKAKSNCEAAENKLKRLTGQAETYTKLLSVYKEERDELSEKYVAIADMLSTPIPCNLRLTWRNYRGSKVCRRGKDYLLGYYKLDDVMMIGPDGRISFADSDLSSGIIVYGIFSQDGEEGLELRSTENFRVKKAGDGEEASETKRLVISKGETYQITIKNLNIGRITVEAAESR